MTNRTPMTHKGSICEIICERANEAPVFRYYYAYGDDPIDMIIQSYVERGYSVKTQYFDTPSTENGSKAMASFLEDSAYRFYEYDKNKG